VITLDTSALLPLINRGDPDHERIREAVLKQPRPYVVPAGILAEIGYLLEHRLGAGVLDAFLSDVQLGGFELDCGERDFPRIRELATRYADLPLGFADAAVVACAERRGGNVAALDRDLEIVAREGSIVVLPART
jgi:hypothetical protein